MKGGVLKLHSADLEKNHDRVRWWMNFIAKSAATILAVWFILDFTRPRPSVTIVAGVITIMSFIDHIMDIFLWSEKVYGKESWLKWFIPISSLFFIAFLLFGVLFLAEAIPYG
jgi:hypothetical protein